ncbi:hypothetical protein ISCGN_012015 [Ixodes scapularis]
MLHRRHSGPSNALGSMMALMVQATVVALVLGSRVDFASCSDPDQDDLENNPELQKYQDGTMCAPVPGKFYLVYRNFEEDPIFGGTAKCVIVTESNKTATGSLLTATYDGGSSTYTASLTSSPGYDVKNVLQIHAEDGTKDLVIAYLECAQCKLLRNKYITSGPACSLFVFGSDGHPKDHTCCDFVFDVLCGASPKYEIYDDSCEK